MDGGEVETGHVEYLCKVRCKGGKDGNGKTACEVPTVRSPDRSIEEMNS
jgi:hypothetical protein